MIEKLNKPKLLQDSCFFFLLKVTHTFNRLQVSQITKGNQTTKIISFYGQHTLATIKSDREKIKIGENKGKGKHKY